MRGFMNRALIGIHSTGIVGLKICVVDTAFGQVADNTPHDSSNANAAFDRQDVEVEIPGMRQYDDNDRWTGQSGFGSTTAASPPKSRSATKVLLQKM